MGVCPTIGRMGGRGCGYVTKLGLREKKIEGDEERQWGDEQIHTRQVRGGEEVRGKEVRNCDRQERRLSTTRER